MKLHLVTISSNVTKHFFRGKENLHFCKGQKFLHLFDFFRSPITCRKCSSRLQQTGTSAQRTTNRERWKGVEIPLDFIPIAAKSPTFNDQSSSVIQRIHVVCWIRTISDIHNLGNLHPNIRIGNFQETGHS